MNLTFLILAHRYPEQLRRLVDRMKRKNTAFVIHIDARVDEGPFRSMFNDESDIYFVEKRCATAWASFGIVEATITCLEFIQINLPKSDRVTLLSGQDYPIKPLRHIFGFLESRPKAIFMEYFKIPDDRWLQKGKTRYPYFERISKILMIYGGSQWWSIPMPVVEYIIDFVKTNQFFIDYFKRVTVPDESFFQTIMLNSDEKFILSNLINTNLHLIKWIPPYQHPRTFNIKDGYLVSRNKYLFARKFDETHDSLILDFIDINILPK